MKTILLFVLTRYSHKRTSSKMSSRTLTWHNIEECTYRFGSNPNNETGKPGDQKAVTTTNKRTSMTTKPTLIAKTKAKESKPTSMANPTGTKATNTTSEAPKTSKVNMKPTTKATLTRESDREERILRMLHDAIF